MKKRASTIFLLLVAFVGLSLLLYPSVSNYWNALHSSRAISDYVEAVDRMGIAQKRAMLDEAYAYNKKLYDDGYTLVLPEPRKESYFKLLDITGTGIMGYIEIPKIDVFLPIYHGTSDEVLQVAVGHIEGSFLPVGGENTHCLLSGHRGLPTAKLFTHLDKLNNGDLFTIRVLDLTLTYEVDHTAVILPDELEELDVVPGQDLCTLMTCTPYGINSHRLLVRGHRVENPEEIPELMISGDALRMNPGVVAVFFAVPVLLAIFILVLIRSPKPPKKKNPPKKKKKPAPAKDAALPGDQSGPEPPQNLPEPPAPDKGDEPPFHLPGSR
ncbi:MAG: class C sortase [Clostridia bacterium]|nr:class C sortase [Clostridia bacterium]